MRWEIIPRAVLIPLVAAALTLPAGPIAPRAAEAYSRVSFQVDIGLFYDDLEPYGDWIEYPDYGWVFVPRVGHSWRPYTVGHWVWTEEYGWLWVSEEPFGWATCHYGRWLLDPDYGWIWVPGYEWAPAWVSFRAGDGYVGWAPLPPQVGWAAGVGFRVGAARIDAYIEPRGYTFVTERSFVDPRLDRRLVPVERNTAMLRVTSNVTHYGVAGTRIVNRSVDPEQLRRVTGRAVPHVRVAETDSLRRAGGARVRDDVVTVFRPRVRPAPDARPHHGRPGRVEVRPRGETRTMERERPEARRLEPEYRTAVPRLESERREQVRRESELRFAREKARRDEESRRTGEREERDRARERFTRERSAFERHPPERRPPPERGRMENQGVERQEMERRQVRAQRHQDVRGTEQRERRHAPEKANKKKPGPDDRRGRPH